MSFTTMAQPIGTLSKALEKELSSDISQEISIDVKHLEEMFEVTRPKLKEITEHFVKELEKGLAAEGDDIPMNPTWVLGFPTGNERGKFITLDMGGTNVRVCEVILTEGRGQFQITQNKYLIPDELKRSKAVQLWSFVADCIGNFINEHHLSIPQPPEKLRLAFTFSYPVTQRSIREGILQQWTKAFDVDGVEGHDVVLQLEAALKEKNLPVEIVVLVNDTTGTLIASAYANPAVKIGSIFSTGCNAAYMEECGSVPKIKGYDFPNSDLIAINTEYGAFDNAHKVLPLTRYDRAIDEVSPRPGQQTYEKMVAGMYLGEIFRLILVDLCDKDNLFRGQDLSRLHQPHVLDSSHLAKMEESVMETQILFKELLSIEPPTRELKVCRYLGKLVVSRAARLYACGIAAIAKKKKIRSCHVGVDGAVFNKYCLFRQRAGRALREILDWPMDSEDLIMLHSAQDGSGIGAALIAAISLERLKGKKGGFPEVT